MEKETEKGFVSWIILAIVTLALLKYFFDWSIFDALASEQGRSTVSYIREVLSTVWSYISAPVTFIWQHVVWPLIIFTWDAFRFLLEEGRRLMSS